MSKQQEYIFEYIYGEGFDSETFEFSAKNDKEAISIARAEHKHRCNTYGHESYTVMIESAVWNKRTYEEYPEDQEIERFYSTMHPTAPKCTKAKHRYKTLKDYCGTTEKECRYCGLRLNVTDSYDRPIREYNP